MKRYLSYAVENLLRHTLDMSSYWTLTRLVRSDVDTLRAPDGRTVRKIVITGSGTQTIEQYSVWCDGANWYVLSALAHAAEMNTVRLRLSTTSGFIDDVFFNLSSGSFTNTASYQFSEYMGSGWYYIECGAYMPDSAYFNSLIWVTSDSATVLAGDSQSGLYVHSPRLRKGFPVGPHIPTSLSAYSGPQKFVQLFAEVDMEHQDYAIDIDGKKYTGLNSRRRYGVREKVSIPIKYVSSLESALINSWWYDGVFLSFQEDFDVSTVALTNTDEPINKVQVPYFDQFEGVIELETH